MKKSFLEEAHKFAGRTMDAAKKQVDKAGEYLETKSEPIKLKIEIAFKKENLEKLFAEYGKIGYYGKSPEEQIAAKETIDSALEELKTLESKLAEITPKKVKEENKYCTKCGEAAEMDDMYCSKCGNELKN